MTFSSTDRYILRKKLELFEKIKGRHTELISVYVPDGYDINKVAQQIRQEVGTASNIKDKNTRKNAASLNEQSILITGKPTLANSVWYKVFSAFRT